MSVRVTEVIERDDHAVLFRGTTDKGKQVTFRVSSPGSDQILAALDAGQHVEVELS